ncbi:Tubulin/FtsZ, GTPase domain-containing protein [Aspergillus transmontanensis]|uniref:Tubulin/FtsZ, GTPase domain-containing protein n=1 Tax=Aspergillus transmontanensis TaxID=1034304 RepID=A0A5N6VNE7_9EURO|nr:Tubulin/FtsZ, GTPase domain-containing protein [Aspergillus transmontanensis]
MSREIDRLAQPADKKKMRLIVASCSRTGTLGLHAGLEMLGYTPYHMIDVMFKGRSPHMKVFTEAIIANHNQLSGIKRYETPDIDKWIGNYDCLMEIPSYIGSRAMRGYIEDPDVKFIVTERSPEKWVRSIDNTIGEAVKAAHQFPLNILKRFDSELGHFLRLATVMYWAYADGANPGNADSEAALYKNYVEYIRSMNDTLPKDRLLVVKLEEGLGWEQICPFLDLPIPEEKYPRGNDPDMFHRIVADYMEPRVKAAMLNLGAMVTATAGIAGYLGWREAVTDEHGLDNSGKFTGSDYQREKLSVYYSETEPQKYVPRAVLVDSKSDTRDKICTGPLRTFFNPRNLLFRGYGAGQCWAIGYHTAGAELIDEAMDMVRREAEECEYLQGFQIIHSVGWGTGGGMGSLLISRLRDEFPDRVITTFSVFPPRVPDVVVQPYNVTLSMNQLIEDCDATFCIDNQALVDTCTGTLGLCDPSHEDLNRLIAQAMSGVTACFRFPGLLNSDLRKLTTTMVPLPRLHFFTLGVSPLCRSASESFNVPRIIQQLFSSDNMTASGDEHIARGLSCLAIFRGKVSKPAIEAQLENLRNKHSPEYIEWVPNDVRWTAYFPHDYDMSGTLLSNSTSIQKMFRHVSEEFSALYRRKAYMNPYSWNGVDEMDFVEAESNLNDLIEEYREHQDGPI